MKILNATLLIILIFTNTPYARANGPDDDIQLQLSAIVEYLEDLLPVDEVALSTDRTRSIISNGVAWIVSSQEDSGHFSYEYLPYEDKYLDDDNIVRQAGTLYVLSEAYRAQSKKDVKVGEAIESSIKYLAGLSREFESGSCVRDNSTSYNCQLGSTALTLLGILSFVGSDSDKRDKYEDLINDYVSFILASRLDERGFSKGYNFGGGFRDSESPFYNGEVMLALVHYYQFDPDPEVKNTLEEVMSYLMKADHDSNLYLWIMATLKDMQMLWPDPEYIKYVEEFTDWRVAKSALYRNTTHNYCAYTEGLASAYSVLKNNVSSEKDLALSKELNYWLNKNARLQVDTTNPYRLTKNETGLQISKINNAKLAHGGFLTGADELTQRIDFTQHCVSSYLQKIEDIDGEVL